MYTLARMMGHPHKKAKAALRQPCAPPPKRTGGVASRIDDALVDCQDEGAHAEVPFIYDSLATHRTESLSP